MKRATILKSRITELRGELERATAERTEALKAVAARPTDETLHERLAKAVEGVSRVSATIDGLTEALESAEQHDRRDAIAEQRADMLAARDRAVEQAQKRVVVAGKIEKAVEALAGGLVEFDSLTRVARRELTLATAGVLEEDHSNGHDNRLLRLNGVIEMLRRDLGAQFAKALKAAGVGVVGIDLIGPGYVEYPPTTADMHAHHPRVSLREATQAAADAFSCQLDNWLTDVGVIVEGDSK
ncbi:MAG TPA: hypothetical protein VHC91_21925 [Trinickia sp.]|uniref:hypothetical protein n=1 Tax=Trinickia sp. TaxID=2571163 RepID=UPI002C4F1C2B|nr:hypothetical protein [Trinickia sp.]HVW53023.1 hypothetical protein [Trinickia sp.]